MTRLSSDIREAGKPIFCSACFNSQPVRHVDFDAACDRGYGNDDHVKIAMDDLVLCENCVKEGAAVLGIEDSVVLKEANHDLERKLDVERKLRVQAQKWADTMEDALASRPERLHIDHRKKPRKSIDEVAA